MESTKVAAASTVEHQQHRHPTINSEKQHADYKYIGTSFYGTCLCVLLIKKCYSIFLKGKCNLKKSSQIFLISLLAVLSMYIYIFHSVSLSLEKIHKAVSLLIFTAEMLLYLLAMQ